MRPVIQAHASLRCIRAAFIASNPARVRLKSLPANHVSTPLNRSD